MSNSKNIEQSNIQQSLMPARELNEYAGSDERRENPWFKQMLPLVNVWEGQNYDQD